MKKLVRECKKCRETFFEKVFFEKVFLKSFFLKKVLEKWLKKKLF